MKIVTDDKIPFLQGVLEPYAEVVYLPGRAITREEVQDADALIVRTRTRVGRELLEGSRVQFVATATIGYDHLDTVWLEEAGIAWTNAPGCNSGSVMQYVAAALAWLSRRRGFSFRGTTLGVVGVGHVGSKVARMAELLGMKVLLNDPPRRRAEGDPAFLPLEQVLAESDIVTLHVPLNREGEDRTLGLVDELFISRMKHGALLINSSRGAVVVDAVVKEALRNGHLGGAVLDVWNHEPEPDPELMALADLATPHIAGYSVDGKANGTAMSVQALARHFGLPLTGWYPEQLPPPPHPLITIAPETPFEEVLRTVILHTYPIDRDDKALREHPERFEELRGNYPVRREFHNYSVKSDPHNEILLKTLEKLKFNIIKEKEK